MRDAWLIPWRLVLLAAVLFVAIFAGDLLLPLGVAGGVPYVKVRSGLLMAGSDEYAKHFVRHLAFGHKGNLAPNLRVAK